MTAAKRWLLTLKRLVGLPYRRAQQLLVPIVFERGMQSTEAPGVSSGHLFLARGLWGSRVRRSDVLLDYGSGKGRMLLAAAHYPFARVIGLELNEPDCEVARANAQVLTGRRWRRRPTQIEVIQADASTWPVPDDVTYIYMFNPFWGEVFEGMLDRVVESLDRRPRPLTIVYANPKCAPELLATGRFEHVRTSLGPRRDRSHHRVEVFRAI